jgi:hypothetical protein
VSNDFQTENLNRFEEALRRFDLENSHDPNTINVNGSQQPRELAYAQWLTDWVLRLCPKASEELRLAARSQHLCRWMVPRNSYPLTRTGYLRWREALKKFHAQKASEVLKALGYSEKLIERVTSLNLKKDFPLDTETRILEDGLCLVFLERQFAELAAKTDDEKMIVVLQKSWNKMTEKGQGFALQIPYGPHEKQLLDRALAKAKGKPFVEQTNPLSKPEIGNI